MYSRKLSVKTAIIVKETASTRNENFGKFSCIFRLSKVRKTEHSGKSSTLHSKRIHCNHVCSRVTRCVQQIPHIRCLSHGAGRHQRLPKRCRLWCEDQIPTRIGDDLFVPIWKVRVTSSSFLVLMGIISLEEKFRWIFKATYNHSRNLACFVFIYKSLLAFQKQLVRRTDASPHR